ncbi:hypothetical protein ACH5RR_011805 [Cinchona calisaya]|uniref:Phospholipase-like protein n=1 Tax=Cinchona calisaya TaxID=153742 RepID=A0ABD3A7F8_9GENT
METRSGSLATPHCICTRQQQQIEIKTEEERSVEAAAVRDITTMGKRPRGKKGREIVAETDGSPLMQLQTPIFSSPPQEIATLPANHRYPTRRSNAVANQCASSTNSLRYPPQNLVGTAKRNLIAARRFLPETKYKHSQADGDLLALEKCTSEFPLPKQVLTSPATSLSHSSPNAKIGKDVKNAGFAVPSEPKDWSAPVNKAVLDIENFTSILLSQSERPEECHPVSPVIQFHENLTEKNFIATEANVEINVRTDAPEKIAAGPMGKVHQMSRSPSFSLTEMAQMSNDEFFDDVEVESAIDPALVTVHEYRVKEEVAPLVRAILAKHGDIAKDCTLESPRARSLFLEMVCGICQKLEKTRFVDITTFELNVLLRDICDLERMKMDVKWLHQRIDEISYVKCLLRDYSQLKKENARNFELIERKEKELAVLQQKVLLAKDELAAMKTKANESNKKILTTKEKVQSLCQESLMHGLL